MDADQRNHSEALEKFKDGHLQQTQNNRLRWKKASGHFNASIWNHLKRVIIGNAFARMPFNRGNATR